MQLARTCTYPKKENEWRQQEVIMSHFFLVNITCGSYRQKIISLKLLSSTPAHAVWKEKIVPRLPYSVPCSSLELGRLGAVGRGRAGNHRCSPPQLTLLPPLHTSVWAITHSPWSSAGKGGNLWPSRWPHCTPASVLCHMGTAGQPWDPRVSQEWQQGARVESTKTDERQRATALQRTAAESQRGSGPWRQEHGPGRFPKQWRASNILLFHQLYSPLNNTGGCGMALQEVKNHPFVKQSSLSPIGMRRGKTARIQVLWQPHSCVTRILPIWNYFPQNHKLLCWKVKSHAVNKTITKAKWKQAKLFFLCPTPFSPLPPQLHIIHTEKC